MLTLDDLVLLDDDDPVVDHSAALSFAMMSMSFMMTILILVVDVSLQTADATTMMMVSRMWMTMWKPFFFI